MVDADDRSQRELPFHQLYQANFRSIQAYAVNRAGSADDAADIVAEATFQFAGTFLQSGAPPESGPGSSLDRAPPRRRSVGPDDVPERHEHRRWLQQLWHQRVLHLRRDRFGQC